MDNQLTTKPNHQGEGGGRPTVIDDAVVALLVGAFQRGLDVRSSCTYAGISKDAFYKKYREDEKFHDTIERAKNNLSELAGDRIMSILKKGQDRDAGPIAMKIFEKKMPEMWGNQPVTNNQQNNFFFVKHEQLADINKTAGIDDSNPVELFAQLEEAERLDDRAEESSSMDLR